MSRYIDEISARENFQDVLAYMGSEVKRMLKKIPTADVVEVRHGYNKSYDYPSLFECSVCGAVDNDTYTGEGEYKYCPWCGAKMDGERKEK